MARGWESKSIESQQDEAAREKPPGPVRDLTPEERRADERRRTLLLSRTCCLSDLEKATRPAQRDMLQLGLAAIESELASLESRGRTPHA